MASAISAMPFRMDATNAQMHTHAQVALQMQVICLTQTIRGVFVMCLRDLSGTLRNSSVNVQEELSILSLQKLSLRFTHNKNTALHAWRSLQCAMLVSQVLFLLSAAKTLRIGRLEGSST